MAVSELVLALDRPAVVEVGDRVVAADGEAVLAEYRVQGEGGAGGEAGQQHRGGEAARKLKAQHGSRSSAVASGGVASGVTVTPSAADGKSNPTHVCTSRSDEHTSEL